MIIQKRQNDVQNNCLSKGNVAFGAKLNASKLPDILDLAQPHSAKFEKAKKYLAKQKKILLLGPSLDRFNMNKLDGIQEGIKVFEGLSMKQIQYLSNDIEKILLSRGCRNNCSHCLESAPLPSLKSQKNMISTMSFEDFKELGKGFRRLNKRLGFNFAKIHDHTIIPFADSDNIGIKGFDKKGNPRNIVDYYKILHRTFGEKILLTTAGWNKTDAWGQASAKALVKYAKKHPESFYQLNISVNPFHCIIDKSIKLKNQSANLEKLGKTEEAAVLNSKSLLLKDVYTNRMSDAMITFSPIQQVLEKKYDEIGILLRHAPDLEKNVGYTEKDAELLYSEVLEKYEQKYNALSDKEKADSAAALAHFKTIKSEGQIESLGRATRFFNPEAVENSYLSANKIKKTGTKYIDANGRLIVSQIDDFMNEVKASTNIQLNFSNKDKNTPHFDFEYHLDNPNASLSLWDKFRKVLFD